jgi:hypothetical protein
MVEHARPMTYMLRIPASGARTTHDRDPHTVRVLSADRLRGRRACREEWFPLCASLSSPYLCSPALAGITGAWRE